MSLLQSGAFTSEEDRQTVGAVLQGRAEGSGEILGVLEQMRDNMKDSLKESMKQEEEALATFGKLEVGDVLLGMRGEGEVFSGRACVSVSCSFF